MDGHVWADRNGNRYGGRHGTLPIDDEPEGESFGAELLDSSAEFVGGPIGGSMADGNGGCYAGLEFIGDVGRVPIDPGVND